MENMMKKMKIDNSTVALMEILMGSGLLYVAIQCKGTANRTFSLMTSAYLFYGAYLNTQKRVVLLAEKPSGDE